MYCSRMALILGFIVTFVFCKAIAMQPEPLSLISHVSCYNETAVIYTYADSQTEIIECEEGNICIPEKGACQDSKPPPQVICPGDGIFPNIQDCNGFVICYAGIPQIFSCNNGSIFDIYEKKCKNQDESDVTCNIFNCTGKNAKFVAHDGDKSLFALCKKSKALSMNQCLPGYTFDEQNQQCDYTCQGVGKLMGYGNQRRYYTCEKDGENGYKRTEHVCPPGMVFLSPYGECIDVKKK